MFFGVGFKTFINQSGNQVVNNSPELKIKLAKTHTVITVFLLGLCETGFGERNTRSDNSQVWVGDDGGDFSPSFTKVIEGIYGSGFN